MADPVDPEFVDYLARSCGLPADVCRRLVLEVLAQYQETLEGFVQRRHKELKTLEGFKNEQIYVRIRSEVRDRRFGTANLTERQIRRMIYG
jgi:hypothetical protein